MFFFLVKRFLVVHLPNIRCDSAANYSLSGILRVCGDFGFFEIGFSKKNVFFISQ